MRSASLEDRVASIEAELARLKAKIDTGNSSEPRWQKLVGVFAGDPAFTEAMRLGREYRQSLRPRHRKRGKR
jgi:hypothetical protein